MNQNTATYKAVSYGANYHYQCKKNALDNNQGGEVGRLHWFKTSIPEIVYSRFKVNGGVFSC